MYNGVFDVKSDCGNRVIMRQASSRTNSDFLLRYIVDIKAPKYFGLTLLDVNVTGCGEKCILCSVDWTANYTKPC